MDLVTTQVHFISGGEVGIPPHKSVQSDKDLTKQQRSSNEDNISTHSVCLGHGQSLAAVFQDNSGIHQGEGDKVVDEAKDDAEGLNVDGRDYEDTAVQTDVEESTNIEEVGLRMMSKF